MKKLYFILSLIVVTVAYQNCSDLSIRKISSESSSASTPVFCSLHGVMATAGEARDFYISSSVPCGSTCNKITRICEDSGMFGPAVDPDSGGPVFPEPNLSNYTHGSCTVNTCTGNPPNPPVNPPNPPVNPPFEQPGCVPPPNSYISELPNPRWPSFRPGWWRIKLRSGEIVSIKFRATHHYGDFSGSDYPNEGDEGMGMVSISKTAGCFDSSKLPPKCTSPASPWPGLSWANKNFGSIYSCNLTPGEDYYLNLYFGPPNGGEWNGAYCPTVFCGRDIGNYYSP